MIEVVDIRKTYRMGTVEVQALRGVSLRIEQGEFVAIMGPSGSGKSTLMHILGLLDVPDGGLYRVDGQAVRDLDEDARAALRARTIGFIFQQFNLLARVSAQDNVALPLIYANRNASASPSDLLDQVGLHDRKEHAPNELSGGQQQRVAIARALVNRPSVIMADEPTGNLDSVSAEGILRLLQDLHRSGLTVIMVTHDPDLGALADRTVVMRDGAVVEDRRRGDRPARVPDRSRPVIPNASQTSTRFRLRGREVVSLLGQAWRSLTSNKLRTALSMLGVLIGVAAVISVLALGAGARKAVQERIASMGANLLVLMPQHHRSGGVSLGAGAVSRLTLADAMALRTGVPGVVRVSAGVRGSVQATHGSSNWRTTLRGVEPDYEAIHSMAPQTGRFFTKDEVDTRARVAVVGITVCKELFGGANPVGQTLRINRDSFEVVGLLPDKGSSSFMDENDQVLVPVTTAMRRVLGETYVQEIEIQVASAAQLDDVERAAVALASKRHRVPETDTEPFQVRNMADLQSMLSSTSNTLSLLLAGIGTISLLVGGIGIMNIMLVNVVERTREIGIRKAVGARRRDILLQFLVESVVVSACGGLLGVASGCGGSLAMSRFADWAVAIRPATLAVAFSFSALVGIVFGIWPARKAAALEPIQALRHE